MTGTGNSSGRCRARGCNARDNGSSVASRISAVAGTIGSDNRANLGEELHWSTAVKSVCELGGENLLSQVKNGFVRQNCCSDSLSSGREGIFLAATSGRT